LEGPGPHGDQAATAGVAQAHIMDSKSASCLVKSAGAFRLGIHATKQPSIFGTLPAASFKLMYSHTIGHRLARFPCRFRSIASPRLPSTAQTVVVLYNRSSLIPWKTYILTLDLPQRLYSYHHPVSTLRRHPTQPRQLAGIAL
jgi:hypothetical protein